MVPKVSMVPMVSVVSMVPTVSVVPTVSMVPKVSMVPTVPVVSTVTRGAYSVCGATVSVVSWCLWYRGVYSVHGAYGLSVCGVYGA